MPAWNRFKLDAWAMILIPIAVLLIGLCAALMVSVLREGRQAAWGH